MRNKPCVAVLVPVQRSELRFLGIWLVAGYAYRKGTAGMKPAVRRRINVGQGAVMTAQGVGAAFSPAIGGWIAQEIGYSAMFMILGSFALGSIALWTLFAGALKPACATPAGRKPIVA